MASSEDDGASSREKEPDKTGKKTPVTTNAVPSPTSPTSPTDQNETNKDPPPLKELEKRETSTDQTTIPNAQTKPDSPQKTIPSLDIPNKGTDENCDKSRYAWLHKALSGQCGLGNSWPLHFIGLAILVILVWTLLFTLLHVEVTPGGDLFKLLVLVLVAYFSGKLLALAHLPPLLGMLIAGIVLRTVGFFKISGVYLEIVIKLREIALTTILIKAGLGLDAPALLKLSLVVLRLAIFPCLAEAVAAAVFSYYILDYPWLWGLLLGFMLSAVSPAVVVPTLLSLKEKGYGEDKGISTLVIAASSLDDIVAISVFGVFLGMLFSSDDLTHQLLQGPLEMIIGLTFGVAWGFLAAFIPHRDDKYVTGKRAVMVGVGGLCAVLGSELIHYSGAGPLACIVASFIACLCWKLQGWSSTHNPVANVFSKIWLILQPILFGLIGAEIDMTRLELGTLGYGMVIILGSLVVRVACCCLVLLGGNLNWKEVIFVNLAWLPKATVQAALGPEALDQVRQQENPSDIDHVRGAQVLTIAVLSILFTAPLGSIGISISGPILLSNKGANKNKETPLAVVGDTTICVTDEPDQNGKDDVGTRV